MRQDPNKFGSDDTRLYFLKDNLTNVPCETDEERAQHHGPSWVHFLPVIFFFAQVYGFVEKGTARRPCCGPCVAWIVDHIIAFAAP